MSSAKERKEFIELERLIIKNFIVSRINKDGKEDVHIKYLREARKYFAGEHGEKPNWEYLSAGNAVAVKDISHYLREQK